MAMGHGSQLVLTIKKPDKLSSFQMVCTSLDYFKYKRVISIFFKQSIIAENSNLGPVFEWLKQDGRPFENRTNLLSFGKVH
jgi:hypothetical protein